MAQKCQNDSINSLKREDRSDVDTPTSNIVSDVPVAKRSSSRGASKHGTGLRLTESGKWGVQIHHPFKKSQVWLGTYNTAEEATQVYNAKKIEYAMLRPKPCEEVTDALSKIDKGKRSLCWDASLRVVESDSSTYKPNCIVLALSAKDHARTKSGISSFQNKLERLSMTQKCQNKIKVSLKEDGAGDTPVPKKFRSLGANKHPGLSITTSGKYGVQIRHPVTRCKVWLGSYSTIEEAKNVYDRKKCDYASFMPREINQQGHSSVLKSKGKRKRKKLVILGISVRETTSGKWGVSYRDPVSKSDIWLGSHLTPEEAAESYRKKKLEFDSEFPEKPSHNVVASTSTAVLKTDGAVRWRVAIRHPMLKHSLLLGSYDSSEEAARAYDTTKLELDAMLQNVLRTTNLPSEATNVNKYTGVRQGGTGRWRSQIQGPFSKKNKIHLGTFSTAEEAAEAFNRARHEFDVVASIVKKRNKAKKPDFLELERMPVDARTRVLEIVVQSHCRDYTKSAATEVSSQGCNSIDNHKEIVHVSSAELEFGMDVIDCYGRLVGEYSRLDDELWLTTPGDDNGFDVNCGFTDANLDLAWGPDCKPSLFPLTGEKEVN